MNKKKYFGMALAGTMVLSTFLTGCGSSATSTTAAAASTTAAAASTTAAAASTTAAAGKETGSADLSGIDTSKLGQYTFTINHSGSGDSHPYQLGSLYFNEKLKEYSGDNMELDIYPSNQLASGAKAVEGTATGSIDMFVENPMSVCNVVPSFDAFNMPYMFESAEEAFAVVDGEYGKSFAEDCEAHGIKLLGYWYNGWRNISNSKRPIEKVEDLQGLTIRIAESSVFADMMTALGMNPVPLANSEIFTALQMGTVDAQENPQNNYINNKYYEVNKYFSITKHVFSVEPVGMNLDLWNSMTEDEQKVLQAAFDASAVYQREVGESAEASQLDQALADGKDIVVTKIDDLTPFKNAVSGVIEKYKQTDLKPYIEALENGVEAYKAAH